MKTQRETYKKVFHLRNRDGSTSEIDIEVFFDKDSGYEVITQAASAAITKAKIEEIRTLNAGLLTSCKEMLRYIERKEAHQGCMDATQLAEAEKRVRETVTTVSTGRWAGDMIYCNLAAARAIIAKAEPQSPRDPEPKQSP